MEFKFKLVVRRWLAIGAGVRKTLSGGVVASTSGAASLI